MIAFYVIMWRIAVYL